MKDKCFIIVGDYINAISVWKSLKSLNVIGPIYFLNTSGRNMVGRIFPKSNVIQGINNPDSFLDFLKSLDKEKTKFLFLTNELFHKAAWENRSLLIELNTIVKIGNYDPSIILDKPAFLKAIVKKTNVPVPNSYSGMKFKDINLPVFVKFKSSYISEIHVPKGKAIYSFEELEKYINWIVGIGFKIEDIEIQELLSTKSRDNISICGWYEKKFHSLHQTRKILQHPPKNGNGDVVEYTQLDEKLADYAMQILSLVDYCGPFEIEFIKARNGKDFKVIEMNPRFWMQHGLIEQISGNLLVARYLGVSPLVPQLKYKFWMYPVISLLKIVKGNLKYVTYFFRKDVYKPISVGEAIRFLWLYLLRL